MSEETSNFHSIQDVDELPPGPCSVVSVFVESEMEALLYARENPGRQVYWIAGKNMGIWYQQLRRVTDRLVWRAPQPGRPL